ncbi:nickel transporter [Pandoraea thiooxydans]|uniref:HoxN/HupN/NixA family nickel/cobalt transporter n=1 Tax=Pandoraea thiooxydans TaxID=445709 RepID=UPI00094A87F8|nr:HoxN/HupN/NixA family nickel/cobalt transporter [Pandoraea thiooxydans]APR97008.1 nickel transporter [Pandoraea thiooxydans]
MQSPPPAPSNRINAEPGAPFGLSLKRRIGGLYVLLIAFNALAWSWAWIAFRERPLLLGTALLAYSLGLRHAVDADHIAAIDNVTRKLMQQGQRPVSVGLMFSLGHSSIVVLASAAMAATALAFGQRLAPLQAAGSLIGTAVSALFLFGIGWLNLLVLRSVLRSFRRVRAGERYADEDFDLLIGNRGLLARLFKPMFRLVSRSWHMYPLGVLFGLGFDTATEIGLLGISAAEASRGMPVWSILVFPMLFTAGMTLIDTTDSLLMLGAYGWAFVKPIRKLYYNLTITSISVVVAFAVAAIETLGLAVDHLQLKGAAWQAIASLNRDFGTLGALIIGLFAASWTISIAIYKWRRLDEVELGV